MANEFSPLHEITKFKEYQVKNDKRLSDDEQLLFRFENGYGASVIYTVGSYGFSAGLMELAVIYWDNFDWHLTYSTKITDDVIGFLNIEQVEELLGKIKKLKENK